MLRQKEEGDFLEVTHHRAGGVSEDQRGAPLGFAFTFTPTLGPSFPGSSAPAPSPPYPPTHTPWKERDYPSEVAQYEHITKARPPIYYKLLNLES